MEISLKIGLISYCWFDVYIDYDGDGTTREGRPEELSLECGVSKTST